MTQDELLTLFSRNVAAPKINLALGTLLDAGRVEQERGTSGPTGGRPAVTLPLMDGR